MELRYNKLYANLWWYREWLSIDNDNDDRDEWDDDGDDNYDDTDYDDNDEDHDDDGGEINLKIMIMSLFTGLLSMRDDN